MATHAGSWFGLPDFGITEAIGSLLGKPTTYQGGSNLIGPQPQPTYASSPSPTPQVFGTTTQSVNGSTSYSSLPKTQQSSSTQQAQPSQPSGPSPEELYRQQMEGQINSGYDNYFKELDNMVGNLNTSATAQGNQANIYANQQTQDLLSQTGQQEQDLTKQIGTTEQNQVKTLKDVADNIRNLMMAGNTYLGSRGAGDSSAVNQYAYALTKLGSQQRGDVQSQTKTIIDNVNDRIAKVKNIATQETSRIKSELGMKTQDIAQWLADSQQQIMQAKANGQLSKSQDLQTLTTNLYNQAVQQLTQLQNAAQNRMAQIESWALSNSTSAKEAIAKAQQYASYQAPGLGYTPISGTPQMDAAGNTAVKFGGGVASSDEYLKRLLGQA